MMLAAFFAHSVGHHEGDVFLELTEPSNADIGRQRNAYRAGWRFRIEERRQLKRLGWLADDLHLRVALRPLIDATQHIQRVGTSSSNFGSSTGGCRLAGRPARA